MKRIGSQIRERISETRYVVESVHDGQATIRDTETGQRERWYANDHHAGYTLQIGRWGYEYGCDLPTP
jgi:hypothetical protein